MATSQIVDITFVDLGGATNFRIEYSIDQRNTWKSYSTTDPNALTPESIPVSELVGLTYTIDGITSPTGNMAEASWIGNWYRVAVLVGGVWSNPSLPFQAPPSREGLFYIFPTGVTDLASGLATGAAGLGYRLRRTDGTLAKGFTYAGVAETGPGTGSYDAAGGVIPVPSGFIGRIQWGTQTTPGDENTFVELARKWIGPGTYERLDAYVSEVLLGASYGAFPITIHVVDQDNNPVELATVRVLMGGNISVNHTDSFGNAFFSLDTGTWTVAITAPGFLFTPTTFDVTFDGTGIFSFTLTRWAVSPLNIPGQSNGYLYTYDQHGMLQGNVPIYFRMEKTPGWGAAAHSNQTFTAISNTEGLLQVALALGATYEAWRGESPGRKAVEFVPTTDPFPLPEILGKE
jgi:hypothetical protein